MKKILCFIITIAGSWLTAQAQDCDIALRAIISPSINGVETPQADNYLSNKLRHLTCQSIQLSSLNNDQFAIAANYDVVDKQIIAGTPTKIVYTLSLNLFIVDVKNSKIFNSFNIELKGVGDNETKALINCYRNINSANRDIMSFVRIGKSKIIDYYNQNYQNIINSARKLAALNNFDEAIYFLSSVPECCVGYHSVMAEMKNIYQQFIDQHCSENIAQARAAWYSSPNVDGASVASVFLSEIYPDAKCYSDALALYKEIKKKMGEDWKFAMQQYRDSIDLERRRINAMREIGIAYANSQPKEITNIFW